MLELAPISGASQDSMRRRAPKPPAKPKPGRKTRPNKASPGCSGAKAAVRPAPNSSKAKGAPKQSKATAANPGCGPAAAGPAKGQTKQPEGGDCAADASTQAVCAAAKTIKTIPSFTGFNPFDADPKRPQRSMLTGWKLNKSANFNPCA